jgi:hypothetical protein
MFALCFGGASEYKDTPLLRQDSGVFLRALPNYVPVTIRINDL